MNPVNHDEGFKCGFTNLSAKYAVTLSL
jgi:hypothetical protein